MIHGKRATMSRRRHRPAVLLLVPLAYWRTLKSLNDSVEGRVSDHSPVVVDLSLREASVEREATRGARPGLL